MALLRVDKYLAVVVCRYPPRIFIQPQLSSFRAFDDLFPGQAAVQYKVRSMVLDIHNS